MLLVSVGGFTAEAVVEMEDGGAGQPVGEGLGPPDEEGNGIAAAGTPQPYTNVVGVAWTM